MHTKHKDTERLKSKGWENMLQAHEKRKEKWKGCIHVRKKIAFKAKSFTKDKEDQ